MRRLARRTIKSWPGLALSDKAAVTCQWEWRLQAEKGRALVASGDHAKGQTLLQSALPQLDTLGTPDWIKAGYRKLLKPAAAPS